MVDLKFGIEGEGVSVVAISRKINRVYVVPKS
jgi:hypothetical protein